MVVRGTFLSIILVLGAAAVATGAIPGEAGAISACYVRNTGVLRVIDVEAAQRCRASEESLSWNEKGPQGEAGPAGPQGETGPAGAPGLPADLVEIQVVKSTRQVPAGVNSWNVSATCPAGLRVIAGGGEVFTSNALMTDSAPTNVPVGSAASGWTASWETDNGVPTGAPFTATAWATCVPG